MRVLYMIGAGLGILAAIFLILGLIAPKEIDTERTALVKASSAEVMATISDFSTWEYWSPWKQADPSMVITPGEKMQGVGASYSWVSENSGNGEQTITAIDGNSGMSSAISFEGMGEAVGRWKLEEQEDGTQVTWGFNSKMPYPMNAMLLFMDVESEAGSDFERGLQLLTEYVEAKASKYGNFTITKTEIPARHYIIHREEIDMEKMAEFFPEHMPRLGEAMSKANLDFQGTPTGLFFTWDIDNERTDMAVGIPGPEGTTLEGFATFDLPVSQAVSMDYYGPYDGFFVAHRQMDEYLEDNNLTPTGLKIEEYVTDPGAEPDPEKWLTRIIYFIEG